MCSFHHRALSHFDEESVWSRQELREKGTTISTGLVNLSVVEYPYYRIVVSERGLHGC